MRPLVPGLVDRRVLFAFGLLGALRGLSLVVMAEAVAGGIVSVLAGTDDWRTAVVAGCAAGILRAVVTWVGEAFATRAALATRERLRQELAARLLAGGTSRVGSTTAIGTVGLDELDAYFRTVLPALMSAATVPLIVGGRILFADWVSAVVIVVTVPLIPVFMTLVGMHTQARADAASATLQRLSDHLVEIARGLPVLVGLGRVEEQTQALRRVSTEHRTTTMSTLRSAFLSSLVLELIATISVAVVAVFVGVRLVHGDLPLAVGLVALILAPECFAPFRDLGSAFHASQDGLAALRRTRELIDEPVSRAVVGRGPRVRLENVTVRYPGREDAVLDRIDIIVEHGTITSIEGASGAGKSTLLGVLAGTVVPDTGRLTGWDPARVAWVPQHPHTVGATVRDELELHGREGVDEVLAQLALTPVASSDPAQLSPGELRRLAVARGLLRVRAGATLLLLDEPTAHLDPANARRVERAIAELRGVTVVLASHETGVGSLARHRILLGAQGGTRAVAPAEEFEAVAAAPVVAESAVSGAFAELLAFLRPVGWRAAGAAVLGILAALFAVALTALSGWLVVRAAEQPPIMYLLVAIVGVRFFGIGRSGLRYAERLLSHDAVLGSVTDLRVRLWNGLARQGLSSRSLTTGAAALDYLVAAADRVRDLVPRVVLPPVVAVGCAGATGIAVGLLHPGALPVLVGCMAVCILVSPAVAVLADRRAAAGSALVRSVVLREFAAMVGAAGELRANGVAARMLARLAALDRRASAQARRSSTALGLGGALTVLTCSVAAVLMLGTITATVPGPVVAVLVLLPLALVDPLLGLVDAVQQWPALRGSLLTIRRLSAVELGGKAISGLPRDPSADDRPGRPVTIDHLELTDLQAAWPDATPYSPVTASAIRGDWIIVEGRSGAGKSTLLATLLGYLPPAAGSWSVNGTDAAEFDPAALRASIAWCPQEAHLFDSTIRGNLLIARPRDDRPTDEELESVVRAVGLGRLLDTLPDGLDTPVGPAGDRLSGGERQRLAVARTLLTRADVVLLDEPTAHLDADAAAHLMADLRRALADRIVVLVSHHADERRDSDVRVALSAG